MAVNIGPKIGIDGEAQFRKEINNLVQQQKTLASELKAVTSQFDQNDKSQEALTAQTKVLNQQIQVQQQRIEKLKEGLAAAAKEFGEADSRTLKWKQAVNDATAEMNRMESQLEDLKRGAGDAGNAFDNAGKKTSMFADVLSAQGIIEAAKGIANAISDIVASTEEYRKIIGTIEVSSEAAGYSAEETKETYKQLYNVLGDTQSAATATANLQALKLSQEDLKKLVELSTGAWATYGDSIPIDSLAESINETIRSGAVTGTFADVLNWGAKEGERFGVALKENTEANKEWNEAVLNATTAEDFFNLALQDASSQAERADVVMQAMASQGLAQTADAWNQNNEDIVKANDSQLEFMENAAEFSERVAPVVNATKEGFNELFGAVLQITEGVNFSAIADEIKSGFSYFTENILPEIENFVSFVIENKDYVIAGIAGIGTAFMTWNVVTTIQGIVTAIQALKAANEGATVAQLLLNAAQAANPIGLVISAIAALVAGIVVLWNTNEGFRDAVINIGKQIAEFVSGVVDTVVNFFTQTIPNALQTVINFVNSNWQGLLMLFVNPFVGAFKLLYDNCEGFRRTVDTMVQNIKQAFSNMADAIWRTVGNIRDDIVNGIGDAIEWIKALPRQAVTWGSDMIQGFANGIMSAMSGLLSKVKDVANTIRSYLHFSRPDAGPLRDYETWMPDMMMGMAKGIRENSWRIEDALNAATSHMQSNVNVTSLPAGGTAALSPITITINAAPGMDEAALADAVARRIQAMTQRKEAVW